MHTRLQIIFIIIFFIALPSCYRSTQEVIEVDFSDGNDVSERSQPETPVLRVAIATVISPRESFVYYQEMFSALSEHLDMRIEFKQRGTYEEVNNMLAQNMVDMAFVCSGAYIHGSDHMELMFVPLVNGEPYYRGYIITNKNSDIHQFDDLRGHSFTHSDPLCFTGKLFVDKRLAEKNMLADEFFGKVIYSLSHDISIQMVSSNIIGGAAVNGLIFEYLRLYQPDLVADIRIIEYTEPGGIPPVVNSLLMSRALRSDIQDFFLNMHKQEQTKKILDNLLIDRFVISGDTLYDGLRDVIEVLNQ